MGMALSPGSCLLCKPAIDPDALLPLATPDYTEPGAVMLENFTPGFQPGTHSVVVIAGTHLLSPMESKSIINDYVTFPHGRLHYRIVGSGTPVFLIHGFGEDSTVWDVLLPFLPDGFLFVMPDVPGSGASDAIDSGINNLDALAAVMEELASSLEIEQAVWIGHSMGGYICLALAESKPALFSAIGLFHSTALADNDQKKENRRKAIGFIREHGSEAFLKTSTPGLFSNKELHLQAIEDLIRQGRNFRPETLVQYYEMMIGRPDRTQVLRTWNKPLLLICGQEDQAVPYAQGLQQSYLADQSYFFTLRQTAHMGMLEETTRSAAILRFFLQAATNINV